MNDLATREMPDYDSIRARILTIRGVPVMLASDLAILYDVPTKRLNEQVKRNIGRFPERFMFRITAEEVTNLRSQIATSSLTAEPGVLALRSQIATSKRGGIRYLPYAFTEHGIIMLASVLNSPTAVAASVRITEAFVAMRKALASMSPILARIAETERRQLEDRTVRLADQRRNDERFETIFKAMNGGDFPPQKVFFEGRPYDAYSFAKRLVHKATTTITLIDGYCDSVTLDILAQKRKGVSVTLATNVRTKITATDIAKFNAQNPSLSLRKTVNFHDRFLVLDGAELYHIGASLKDLGRKCFAITKMDATFIPSILRHI